MSWRKYFTTVKQATRKDGSSSPLTDNSNSKTGPARTNYSSYLPDIYVGSPNRIERYGQYNVMDLDSEVNAALDILAEFTTQQNEENKTPFILDFNTEATSSEVKIIQQYLQQWCRLQNINQRIFRIMRNIFKYGDQFFVRDPETMKLYHVDPAKVSKIIVNESEGKIPEQYIISDINFNFKNLVATTPFQTNGNITGGGNGYLQGGVRGMVGNVNTENAAGSRFYHEDNELAVSADNVLHLSLSEGLDFNYPFGTSLLETVFKVYKQKELLEDAIIIYRVQRAPERRVFYVDVGNMPAHLAMQFVERVKTEIHQRRIPSASGGGQSVIDSAYNPLCLSLDTEIPLLDGRTLKLSQLILEFEKGHEHWIYSCDPVTGKIVPGVVTWAGVTKQNAEVIKLNLNNGKSLICTPDHKIPVFGKGFVEARMILKNDRLIGFNRRNSKIKGSLLGYEQVWDHLTRKWRWTHDMVGNFFKIRGKHQEFTYSVHNLSKQKNVIHHRDFNVFNNDPRNLEYMNDKDYIEYHDYINSRSNKSTNILTTGVVRKLFSGFKDYLIKVFHIQSPQTIYVTSIESHHAVDTGTITVDGSEKWHKHHTFAVDSGIFVKNSINEDYFFPQTSEGRGSKVETLPGGTNLGEIDDLKYFTNKLVRGLRIPSSYLPTGPDDGQSQYNDGRVGTAYIQELRFNTYCERLQNLVVEDIDQEFKLYLIKKGVNIDISMFDIKFQPPQNFAAFRQSELDNARIPTFTQMAGLPYMSKRFALKRFLGLTDEEISQNENMWKQENDEDTGIGSADPSAEMRGAGITSAGLSDDFSGMEGELPMQDIEMAGDESEEGLPEPPAGPAGEQPAPTPAGPGNV